MSIEQERGLPDGLEGPVISLLFYPYFVLLKHFG